jgi:general secretion pathway protein K
VPFLAPPPACADAAPPLSGGTAGGTGEEGFALVLVLVVVGLLVTLVVQFNYASRVELEMARSYVESIQAAYLAEAGVHVAMALLRTDDNESTDGKVIDTLDDQWAQWPQDIPIPVDEEASVYLGLEDTGRYLNVNRLVNDTGETVDEELAGVFEELLRQLGRDDAAALVDSVIDWIDPDDQITNDGAEEGYYRSLDPPVEIANHRLLSAEELRLVKGFDDQLLNGAEEVPGLLRLVTVYGPKTFNLNTVDAEDVFPWLLTSLGGADTQGQTVIDETVANDIRAARGEEPFSDPLQIKIRGLLDQAQYNAIQKGGPSVRLLEVTSSYFTIRAVGVVGQPEPGGDEELTRKSVIAIVKRDPGGKVNILYWREE